MGSDVEARHQLFSVQVGGQGSSLKEKSADDSTLLHADTFCSLDITGVCHTVSEPVTPTA